MCGVIGYWPEQPNELVLPAFDRLLDESRVRGMHAYGVGWMAPSDQAPTCLRGSSTTLLSSVFGGLTPFIAHTRYSTSGDWRTAANNQPIQVGAMALAFNGIISMGTKAEFEAEFGVACDADNDGEVFLRRLMGGESALSFLSRIKGSFAGVWLDRGRLFAARNERRPLWCSRAYGAVWYASTADIFRRAGFDQADPVAPFTVLCHEPRV